MTQPNNAMPNNAMRVFVAVAIPADAKRELGKLIDRLALENSGGVRWVALEGIHLTMKFLGDVEPSRISDVVEAMSGAAHDVAPFCIQLSGLGMFPNDRRPRVLWAGVAGDLGPMQELQHRIEDSMAGLGFYRDKRPFNHHLNVGRVRDQASDTERRGIGAAFSRQTLGTLEPWLVEKVHLIQSHLGPRGATSSDLASRPLEGAK